MNKLLKYIFLFLSVSSFAQVIEIPADRLDRLPNNMGGKSEFKRFFNQEVMYPEESLKNGIGGTVVIKFVLRKDGTTDPPRIIQSVNPEIDAEAVRLFRKLQWLPAVYEGKVVDAYHLIEFTFLPNKYKSICKKRGYKSMPKLLGDADSSDVIYDKTEQVPYYGKGIYSLQEFIVKNLQYPKLASLNNIQGKVMVRFVVEPSGFTTNIAIEKSVGAGCDEEAIRIIELLKWNPGIKDRKMVRCQMHIPIDFNLDNSFKDNSNGEQRQ